MMNNSDNANDNDSGSDDDDNNNVNNFINVICGDCLAER